MEDSDKLDAWLAAARSDLAQREPDLLAEQQLLTRVGEMRALRSVAATQAAPAPKRARHAAFWRRPFGWRSAAFAGGAVAVVIGAIGVNTLTSGPLGGETTARTPFLALVASEAIAAERSAVVVSSQVAASTLHDYGLPVDPARADQPVRAEFLVSPTGLVLAVRFAE